MTGDIGRLSGEGSKIENFGSSWQNKEFDLKPWDGQNIPLLEESSRGSKDSGRHYVNQEINEFNDQLYHVTHLRLDHLPQVLQEEIKAWVTGITNNFARKAHKTSKSYSLFTPRASKELTAFNDRSDTPITEKMFKKLQKLIGFKNELEGLYTGLKEANQKWPFDSTGDHFKLTSILKDPDILGKLGYLPRANASKFGQ